MTEIHYWDIFGTVLFCIFLCRQKFPNSRIFYSKSMIWVSWAFRLLLKKKKKIDLFDGLMIRFVGTVFFVCGWRWFVYLFASISNEEEYFVCKIRFDLIVIQYTYILAVDTFTQYHLDVISANYLLCALVSSVRWVLWWHRIGYLNCWFIRKQLCNNYYRKKQGICSRHL